MISLLNDYIGFLFVMYLIATFGIATWGKLIMKRGFHQWVWTGLLFTPFIPLIILLIRGKKKELRS